MPSQLQIREVVEAMGAVGVDQLTPVLFASDDEEAIRFCALLEDVNIPALVGDHTGAATRGLGVPVLVPESLQEWSSEILASAETVCADHDIDDDDDDEEDEDDDFFPDDPDDDDLDDDEDDELLDDDLDKR
jgi:hypothetical protein